MIDGAVKLDVRVVLISVIDRACRRFIIVRAVNLPPHYLDPDGNWPSPTVIAQPARPRGNDPAERSLARLKSSLPRALDDHPLTFETPRRLSR